MLWHRVDTSIVEQIVNLRSVEGFVGLSGKRADRFDVAGVAGEDVSGRGRDGFEIGQVGGGGADAGEDGVGIRLGELADEFESETAVGAWR